ELHSHARVQEEGTRAGAARAAPPRHEEGSPHARAAYRARPRRRGRPPRTLGSSAGAPLACARARGGRAPSRLRCRARPAGARRGDARPLRALPRRLPPLARCPPARIAHGRGARLLPGGLARALRGPVRTRACHCELPRPGERAPGLLRLPGAGLAPARRRGRPLLALWLEELARRGLTAPAVPLLATRRGTPSRAGFVWRLVERRAFRAWLAVRLVS